MKMAAKSASTRPTSVAYCGMKLGTRSFLQGLVCPYTNDWLVLACTFSDFRPSGPGALNPPTNTQTVCKSKASSIRLCGAFASKGSHLKPPAAIIDMRVSVKKPKRNRLRAVSLKLTLENPRPKASSSPESRLAGGRSRGRQHALCSASPGDAQP